MGLSMKVSLKECHIRTLNSNNPHKSPLMGRSCHYHHVTYEEMEEQRN